MACFDSASTAGRRATATRLSATRDAALATRRRSISHCLTAALAALDVAPSLLERPDGLRDRRRRPPAPPASSPAGRAGRWLGRPSADEATSLRSLVAGRGVGGDPNRAGVPFRRPV